MEFRTKLPYSSPPFTLNQQNDILCIGSCFAETIGNYLMKLKFNVTTNPLGTIFNPISITGSIKWGLMPFNFMESLVTQKEGRYTYFLFHSDIYAESIEELKVLSEKIHTDLNAKLHLTDTLIITLGTAFAYQHIATNTYVSNCHKVPQKEFKKVLLNQHTIEASLTETINILPNIKNIILTVSPIRHLKDTIELNSVSKATLRLVCHQLKSKIPNTHYFPSFEIILDDLRDYRFYKEDMIHPTKQAKSYVCDYFSESMFTEDTKKINLEISKIQRAVNHRPFNTSSKEHQNFLKKTIEKINQFPVKLNLKDELLTLSKQLL